MRWRGRLLWALAAAVGPAAAQEAGPVPPGLRLAPFYARHVSAGGLPVVGSAQVSDAALLEAARIAGRMLAHRPDLLAALRAARVRVAVMAASERATDIPEHSDLRPREEWDSRTRGVGATRERPVCSAAEENLLGLPQDRYSGESIFIHEFAHTIADMALSKVDSSFDRRLRSLYRQAMWAGLWRGTYAASNHSEYWAEGVQSWFDANKAADPPNGIHNHVATRQALEQYDPGLARLIASVFREDPWRWERPGLHTAAQPKQPETAR